MPYFWRTGCCRICEEEKHSGSDYTTQDAIIHIWKLYHICSTWKFKRQLVSHGNEQDTLLYPDISSPMIGIHTNHVGTCWMLTWNRSVGCKGCVYPDRNDLDSYAYQACRCIALTDCWDIPRTQGIDEVLYCRLKKALYGCVQASNLWHRLV